MHACIRRLLTIRQWIAAVHAIVGAESYKRRDDCVAAAQFSTVQCTTATEHDRHVYGRESDMWKATEIGFHCVQENHLKNWQPCDFLKIGHNATKTEIISIKKSAVEQLEFRYQLLTFLDKYKRDPLLFRTNSVLMLKWHFKLSKVAVILFNSSFRVALLAPVHKGNGFLYIIIHAPSVQEKE